VGRRFLLDAYRMSGDLRHLLKSEGGRKLGNSTSIEKRSGRKLVGVRGEPNSAGRK